MDTVLVFAFAAVLAVVAFLLLGGTKGTDTQAVRRTIPCPDRARAAECVLVRDVRTGRFVGVARCSLRAPRGTCSEDCVRLLDGKAPLTRRPRSPSPP